MSIKTIDCISRVCSFQPEFFARPRSGRTRLNVIRFLTGLFAITILLTSARGQTAPFSVSLSKSSLVAYPGTSNDIQVHVNSDSGYLDTVVVTLTGLPSGVSANPSSLNLAPGDTGTVTLSSALNADAPSFPAVGGQPNSSHKTITFVGNSNGATASASLSFTTSLSNTSFTPDPASTGLSVINITTTGGVPITSTDIYVPGIVTITPGVNSTFPSYSGTMTIKGHGHSTWGMPKKPYKFKLDSKASLMGMPAHKSWVLLANYSDKTMLRDYIASELSDRVGLPWAPHSGYAEVYLNGAYIGTYELIEQVKVASSRVNITSMSPTDTSGDALTGGYLLEIDTRQDQAFIFTTTKGVPFGLEDPDFTPDPEIPEQTSYIQNYVQTAEDALFSPSFTDPATGWQAYFDANALVNFYLVNDIMGNRDGGRFYSSDYMYKNRGNPLLYMGPVWDFDISSGNENESVIENPTVPWMNVRASWYARLFTDTAFKSKVVTQWNAVKSAKFDTLPDFIDQAAATVAKAQQNNFTRWPILGETVWPNPQALGSYQAEVDYLKTWLKLRIAYLDSQFNGKAATQTLLSVSDTSPHFGDIVKLTSTVSDPSATPVTNGSVSFLSGALVLGSATLDGTGSATFTTADLPVGTDAITAVYSGDATNGLSASNATTVHVSPSIAPTIARLSASSGSIQQNAAVTLAASITTSNGNGTPNGTFTFFSGATQVGSASLEGGAATATLTNLPAGTDSVTARYSGDESYQPSTSNAVIINVIPTASTATPIFTPAGGTYTSTQSVTISDASTGAVIYYTTDSSTPTTSSTVYAGAITVSASMTLKAMAVAPGMNASPIATAAYLIQSSTACSVPAIVGVHVCNPVVGSAYSSPLQITATGKGASGTVSRMEVWLDGVKKYSNAGSSVTVSMTMTSGPHYVNVVEVDSKGAYVKSGRINFTITATCSTPTSPGVHMCTPLTGASYSSPIVVKAAGAGASGVVSRMELWIDGKKISNYPGAFINTSVSLPAGVHQATTVEVDSKGAYLKSAVAKFTVK